MVLYNWPGLGSQGAGRLDGLVVADVDFLLTREERRGS